MEDIYLNYDVEPSIVKLTLCALGIAAAFAIPQWLILYRSTTGAGLAEYVVVGVAALALGGLTTFKDLLKLK